MDNSWRLNALKKIEAIFRNHFFDDSIQVTEVTSPADILEWDSLAHIELLAAVELEFGIRFSADEMSAVDSVKTILDVVHIHAKRK